MNYIKEMTIKNFKGYVSENFDFSFKNYILIGENDSGKSSVLEALDLFFNLDKIDKTFANDPNQNIEIEVKIETDKELIYCKKVFKKGAIFKFDPSLSEGLDKVCLNYIYLHPLKMDVDGIIKEFAIKKTIEKFGIARIEELKEILNESEKEVLKNIDSNLIVVNPNIETELSEEASIKLERALEIKITSSGIPLECRGLGYRRNLIYALVAQSNYQNTIIGIDEIENSLSLKNVENLLQKIHDNFPQSFITTHSVNLLAVNTTHNVYPIFGSSNYAGVADLYEKMGHVRGNQTILLVEGITDCYWFRKALGLLNEAKNYIVVSVNGKDNFNKFISYYTDISAPFKAISDGDAQNEYSLERDCIELYTPVSVINEIFNKKLVALSTNKEGFFNNDLSGVEKKRAKNVLASRVNDFLTLDNPLIDEVKRILNID